ncbi:hypothetical protein PR048_026868 [Dryococelus australis]|uniref:Uncharacterized protein n=1 Tax=Dryococelus australis TaxID=614101 RepID=A0ABQ9GMK1_9NEOP|nr:hypothetical protein PR048_026868 [Dryococelus australis]
MVGVQFVGQPRATYELVVFLYMEVMCTVTQIGPTATIVKGRCVGLQVLCGVTISYPTAVHKVRVDNEWMLSKSVVALLTKDGQCIGYPHCVEAARDNTSECKTDPRWHVEWNLVAVVNKIRFTHHTFDTKLEIQFKMAAAFSAAQELSSLPLITSAYMYADYVVSSRGWMVLDQRGCHLHTPAIDTAPQKPVYRQPPPLPTLAQNAILAICPPPPTPAQSSFSADWRAALSKVVHPAINPMTQSSKPLQGHTDPSLYTSQEHVFRIPRELVCPCNPFSLSIQATWTSPASGGARINCVGEQVKGSYQELMVMCAELEQCKTASGREMWTRWSRRYNEKWFRKKPTPLPPNASLHCCAPPGMHHCQLSDRARRETDHFPSTTATASTPANTQVRIQLKPMVRNKHIKKGHGILNALINKLPFELYLPKYNYCGPGTKLAKCLA